jgi:ribonuclease HI
MGGWAAIIRHPDGREQEISGAEMASTNNRMELTAAIKALEALSEGCPVIVHADSQYVTKGMTEWMAGWVRRGWISAARKPVENQDLWMRLSAVAAGHKVTWTWVRGHAEDTMNIRVDQLANAARERLRRRR